MSDNPNEIRANIEATRFELSNNVDALADKVDPSKIAERQTEKVKGAFRGVRERVMGAVSDVGDNASGVAGSATDSVSGAAQTAKDKVQGSPFAIGLIAFGAGLLAASLVPASTKEKEIASNIKEQAQPLVEQVTDAAKEVAGNLKEPAQEAAAAVKDTATDAASSVQAEAQSAVSDVQDQAGDAKHALQNEN
ncbi:DUF3618 domain-containing protein [Subtercola lobariae]|uniref:DUF3618 domain-containing protein n=1 Tax=Subtercola lobariae TaxID=1588641 RepID=A0A917F2B2_9MICO|nr:DUF3618 domain-containing protein [Subtercola lobariae]GGF41441.1 hypothetical protein GCM10011399_37660 [Subtercola lobariae]